MRAGELIPSETIGGSRLGGILALLAHVTLAVWLEVA